MKNKIAIREMEIDWLSIIDLAFKRKDWGKVYTVYTCGDVTVNCEMESFNFAQAEATFKIKVGYMHNGVGHDGSDYEDYTYAYYHLKNFEVSDFKRIIKAKIRTRLELIKNANLKSEAVGKFILKKHFKGDINQEMYIKFELKGEYDKIDSTADEELKEELFYVLEDRLLKKANAEFEDLVKKYCQNNSVDMPNIDKIIDRIGGDEE